MIIARSPLRVSLGGGGTDLPSYYREHGGFLVAGAIDKYVYVTVHDTFLKQMLVRYSQIEWVNHRSEIKHPIIREALQLLDVREVNLEITTIADIPAGTGLGSSGSFTTALLKALYKYKRAFVQSGELAEQACHIELDLLGEPIGKQDQYIAAFGGLSVFEFEKSGKVNVRPLRVSEETYHRLHDNLLMFSTGTIRSASAVLKDQNEKTKASDKTMLDNLHYNKELGYKSLDALESGDLVGFGRLMHDHWENKKKRTSGMSSGDIDRWYAIALEHGAIGGKVIGAGGGGFLMFYTEKPGQLREAMRKEGLFELRFGFDFDGTKLLG
ncbi:MAG: galactokinase [Deltaproteobacteria bacterium]|nr:galactokinase [Deltaproteobacteria bacterium]